MGAPPERPCEEAESETIRFPEVPNMTQSAEPLKNRRERAAPEAAGGNPAAWPPGELQAVLAAWNAATERLQHTHEALRAEVRRLTDELEVKNRELARKNRLADLGQMAAHVAHELRNGLVPVKLYLDLLQRRIGGDSGSLEVLDKALAGLTAVDGTVNDLLQFASDRAVQLRPFRLAPLVAGLLETLAPTLSAQSVAAEVEIPPDLRLIADEHMIQRCLMNLVLNAVDAMPDGGRVKIAACRRGNGVAVEVADSGPGLSDDALHRAFEPFFTTKRQGTGLGLAIVARAVEAHGGEASIGNRPEGGASVELFFPTRAQEAAA